MKQFDIKYGLMAAGISLVIKLACYLISMKAFTMVAPYVAAIPMVTAMVLAVLNERKINKGFISFKNAFSHAWVNYLVYGLIMAVFVYVLYNFVNPELSEITKQEAIELIEKFASSNEEMRDAQIKAIEDMPDQSSLTVILTNFLITLLFPGAFCAAIIALICKKEGDAPWKTL